MLKHHSSLGAAQRFVVIPFTVHAHVRLKNIFLAPVFSIALMTACCNTFYYYLVATTLKFLVGAKMAEYNIYTLT